MYLFMNKCAKYKLSHFPVFLMRVFGLMYLMTCHTTAPLPPMISALTMLRAQTVIKILQSLPSQLGIWMAHVGAKEATC